MPVMVTRLALATIAIGMVDRNRTPRDYGLRIRSHPNGLWITSLVKMRESQTLRLQRLFPGSIVKAPVQTILVPRPADTPGRGGGQPLRDVPLLRWVAAFARDVLEVAPPAPAQVADPASRA